MVQTTWCGADAFVRAYNGEGGRESAVEAAECFRVLFAAMRGERPTAAEGGDEDGN
jgi:hypothetical protein